MKTKFSLIVVCVLMLGILFVRPAPVIAEDMFIMKFDTMVGVPLDLTDAKMPIRGIDGGGLPWVIAGADGKLSVDGRLTIRVTGLVLDPNDPTVISRGLAGQNPIPDFRGIVSCLASDGSVVNVMTAPFPATTGLATEGGGDAFIKTFVTLPHPCIAPIIFVASPTGAWFAVTGH